MGSGKPHSFVPEEKMSLIVKLDEEIKVKERLMTGN
jgi:hypothetical protein